MDDVIELPVPGMTAAVQESARAATAHFHRQAVDESLQAHPHAKLIQFSAPAGFGKTVSMQMLAASRMEQGALVAWLNIVDADNDPTSFFARLIATISAHSPGFGNNAQGYLRNSLHIPVDIVMESLLVELAEAPSPMLLVLDDLHRISNVQLQQALNRLVEFSPQNFTLVIGCRSQPQMQLARLRAKGLLLEIGEQELRLTKLETQLYLKQRGHELSGQALENLYTHTGGWVLGVHLASLWLGHRADAYDGNYERPDEPDTVAEYLLHSVLSTLPADEQALLMTLAVAQQVSGELVDSLTGGTDGQATLQAFEARQLFLRPLDHERHWYRFHDVFADFLRNRLQAQDPARFKQLNYSASHWFAAHDMQALAIRHAHLADDPRLLAELIEAAGMQMINQGELSLITYWRQHVPYSIASEYPVLMLVDVWTRATQMGLQEANRNIDDLLQGWGELEVTTDLSDRHLAALAIKAVIALQKDDLVTCVLLARRVEVHLGQHSAFVEVTMLIVGAIAHVMMGAPQSAHRLLALAQQRNHFLSGRYLEMQLANVDLLLSLEQGQIKQAALLYSHLRLHSMPWFAERSQALVLSTVTGAVIKCIQGEFEGLESRLRWALDTVDLISPIDVYAQGLLCLSRLQRMQENPKEAHATLVMMQNMAARHKAWRFYAMAVGDEVAQILQETAVDRIKRAELRLKSVDWDSLAAPYLHMRFNPVKWMQGLTRVRLQQARGHSSEALHEITHLRALLLPDWHGLHRLRLDLLSALSYQRLGYQERSQTLLVQCLIDAEREGIRTLFIEEGDSVRLMLQQLETAERQPALQGFIRQLLAIWPGYNASQTLLEVDEGLTEREREVVCLAAQGMSNAEIGEQLELALGTVKWHLHNIYEKLKVRNRTQAIRRARELSLL